MKVTNLQAFLSKLICFGCIPATARIAAASATARLCAGRENQTSALQTPLSASCAHPVTQAEGRNHLRFRPLVSCAAVTPFTHARQSAYVSHSFGILVPIICSPPSCQAESYSALGTAAVRAMPVHDISMLTPAGVDNRKCSLDLLSSNSEEVPRSYHALPAAPEVADHSSSVPAFNCARQQIGLICCSHGVHSQTFTVR